MDVLSLKRQLDLPTRLKDSLSKKPTKWLLGSSAIGLASTLLLPRLRSCDPKPRISQNRTGGMVTRLVWKISRPLIKKWLTQKLTQLLTGPPRQP